MWQTGANFQPQLGRHNQHNRSLALAPVRHTEFLDEVLGARLHPVTKEFSPDFSLYRTIFLQFSSPLTVSWKLVMPLKLNLLWDHLPVMLNLW